MAKNLTYEVLERRVKELEIEVAEREKGDEKIRHLNLLLRAIRNVNQVLMTEKDRTRLIQRICNNLVETRGYYNAWIVLFDDSGDLVTAAQAGLGKQFPHMVEQLERGKLIACAQRAMAQSGIALTENPISTCSNCPLSINHAGREAMTVGLAHNGKNYGLLCVSTPRDIALDEEEQGLIQEIAGDIASSLHGIEVEEGRKQMEEALSENEKKLSQIVQASSIPTFVIDNEHTITHWNKACENLTGISSNEIIGTKKQWSAFYVVERPVMADFIVEKAPEKEIAKYYGGKYLKSDVIEGGYEAEDYFPALGEKGKWLFFTAAPLRGAEEKIIGAIETLQDIGRRKKAEELSRKSMQELGDRVRELNCLFSISKLVEKGNISLGEILQGTVGFLPPAWQYPEITGARIILDGQEFKTKEFKKTKWRQAKTIIVEDEQRGILEVCYLEQRPEADEGPFLSEERNLLNAIAERIGKVAELKQTEAKLLNSEKRFRDLVENSLVGISIIQDDTIVYQNPEQERIHGPLPRKSILIDHENIHTEDVEKIKEFYNKIISGKVQTLETDFRFFPGPKGGGGPHMKWVHCRSSPIEYQGKEAILVNMMDVTMAKEMERLLDIQGRMASLGHVAAGIAHEIRNPLSGINIYLNTLEKIYDKAASLDKVKGILAQLQSASSKIESVIRRVMDFSKPSEPNLVLTDINQPIEEAIKLSAVTMRKSGIMIEKELAEDLPPCHADPHLIEQVILNLITNAAEAMKGMGDSKKIGLSASIQNNRILVRVSDSGPGVPVDLRDKIFNPFYTTKEGSTGIGLSLSHRIITDHGGFLRVSQSKWGGAQFIIEIPIERGRSQI